MPDTEPAIFADHRTARHWVADEVERVAEEIGQPEDEVAAHGLSWRDTVNNRERLWLGLGHAFDLQHDTMTEEQLAEHELFPGDFEETR